MKTLSKLCLMLFIPVISGFAGSELSMQLEKGDSLYNIYDDKGALDAYLNALTIDSLSYEANWKASRAYLDVGEVIEDEDERADYYQKGTSCARRAVRIEPEGSKGHLFLAIALGRIALDAGAKERIRLSKQIKDEVDLSIKYNPKDDIAYHVLGRWNRKLSNLSWIEKGFADMFLGGIPDEASDENAVEAFKKAIELNPKHINHHLELGITYEMMGLDDEARQQYEICLELPKSDSDDDKYKKEARERLEDL
jgi:tetratricopeptide (TPR) repeat protein